MMMLRAMGIAVSASLAKINGTTDDVGLTGHQRTVCAFFILMCIYSHLFDYLRLTIRKSVN